jgi:hypothetical protein
VRLPSSRVRSATTGDAISAVLASAFADDPVFTWMIPDAARRAAILPDLFAPFAEVYQPLGASTVIARSGRGSRSRAVGPARQACSGRRPLTRSWQVCTGNGRPSAADITRGAPEAAGPFQT